MRLVSCWSDGSVRSLAVVLEIITSEPDAERLKSKMKFGKAAAVGATMRCGARSTGSFP